ncbi:MAG TPA: peptidoglycan-associated lipoprotein Pal [Gemmatimonadaceae bacterium]|nr:peptidoglycan-associated lipoprotein Pal [Gemmatimonadaceae bacterium]
MTGKTRLVSVLVVAAAAAVACSHPAPKTAPAPAQGPNQDSINAENARRDSIARADAARRDSIAKAQADADRLRNGRDAATKALTQVIYFDFDSDALKDDARSSLDSKITILNASPDVKIRVGGNTDERGSDEYNLALGQRRAASAKRYLTDHGISADRIDIISYGEEHPVATGHDESSWSQNRRDGFEITAGADQIKGAP